ncbi:tetratricopeptide repeat protein [Nitrospirillum bahiense]|uniref:Tetratricopeptide (TPR) repeat protein n=1 Tax=Nitrospirillum amazonense TaxID=28077 RepID=A0A560FUQ0_9PROT|nr:tetratricopeptide repeat protein [Nitrospirillum amazonense]TWB25366.1 tetratricopeptide (TPR) repeat protein [Nitrospirillum amazonense]
MVHGGAGTGAKGDRQAGGQIPGLLAQAMDRHRAGDLAGAETLYRRILALDPAQADALNLCGVACHQQGRSAEGRVLLERALAARPDDQGSLENLGLLLVQLGDAAAAVPLLRHALRLFPRSVSAWMSLGLAYTELKDHPAAMAAYHSLLDIAPTHVPALLNLGDLMRQLYDGEGAVIMARRLLALEPANPRGLMSLANALQVLGDLPGAEAAFTRALAADPQDPAPRYNRAYVRLAMGQLPGGWADYTSRFVTGNIQPWRYPDRPQWAGDALDGRRLMMWREQGLGDEFMFSPLYVPALRAALGGAAGGSVVILTEPRLIGLMSRYLRREVPDLAGRVELRPEPLGGNDFDVHLPAGGLPALFGARLRDYAGRDGGWLAADPQVVARWRQRLADLGPGLKIGMCWTSGIKAPHRDPNYLGLTRWAPLLSLPGITWVDLQYSDVTAERRAAAEQGLRLPHRFTDLDQRNDIEGVAALISALDMVITAPTSVGELAGALGVPIWRMELPGDWSMLGTRVRPWYPAMRIFPAETVADALDQVRAALLALSNFGIQTNAPGAAPRAMSRPPDLPTLAQAYDLLTAGRATEAVAALDALIAWGELTPAARGQALHLLGLARFHAGDAAGAVPAIVQALALLPPEQSAMPANNLGNVLRQLGRLAEAEAAYRRALAQDPALAAAASNLGALLRDRGDLAGAEAALLHALRLAPEQAETLVNLAGTMTALGAPWQAESLARRAVALAPGMAHAHGNLGTALVAQGRLADGTRHLAAAGALDAGEPLIQFNLGLARLAQGDLAAGWQGYARRDLGGAAGPLPAPPWRGQDLAGRTLLVRREQGLGDELLFASLYPDLAAQVGRLVIDCDPRLAALFARAFPGAVIAPAGRVLDGGGAPVPDAALSAGDLPALLRPDLASFAGGPTAYLTADPALVALWARRLAALGRGLKVGLCWRSGLRTEERGRLLYPQLDEWDPLLRLPHVHFVSLQYDGAAAEPELVAAEARLGIRIHRWPDLDLRDDLDGVAALISGLDLVVTAGTAVSELAGALGVPCWRLGATFEWTRLGSGARPWFPAQQPFFPPEGEVIGVVLPHLAWRLAGLARAAVAVADGPAPSPPAPSPDTLYADGLAARDAGRVDLAVERLGQAADAGHAGALAALAGLLRREERWAAAADRYRQLLRLRADNAEALSGLGLALQGLGQGADALRCHDRAVQLAPDRAALHANRGLTLTALGNDEAAAEAQRRATEADPGWVGGWVNLGVALARLNRPDAALEAFHRALAIEPASAAALSGLANLRLLLGQPETAAAHLRAVLTQQPDDADTHLNLGRALFDLRLVEEARDHYRRALALRPGWAKARVNLSMLALELGDLEAGWHDYPARFAVPDSTARRDLVLPAWTGGDLRDRALLVWGEQGLGDEILFASCLPGLLRWLGARGCRRLVVEVDARLAGLLSRALQPQVPAGLDLVVRGRTDTPRDADMHVPLGGLPALLRHSLGDFPADPPPWLHSDAQRAAFWRGRLAALGPGLKVGLCWRSGLRDLGRQNLYLTLMQMVPLLTVPDVHFVVLQYDARAGDAAAEMAEVAAATGVTLHLWDDLDLRDDQEGVAALMAGLDLVVSAGTAVGELSAALDVPTWRFQHMPAWASLGTGARPWFQAQRQWFSGWGPPEVVVPAMRAALLRLRAETAAGPPMDNPATVEAGMAAHRAGDLAGAEAAYRSVLARAPGDVDALHLLGVVMVQDGRVDEGVGLLRRAVAADPAFAQAHNSLGGALRAGGDLSGALSAFSRATELMPDYVEAWGNLAGVHVELRAWDAALAAAGRALALRSGYAKALVEQARALAGLRRTAEGLAAARAAVAAEETPYTLTNLGLALGAEEMWGLARACHERALALDPTYVEAANNLALTWLGERGPTRDAIHQTQGRARAGFQRALALRPDFAAARYNLAILDLAEGRLPAGWSGYQARFDAGQALPDRRFPQPRWQGEALGRRRLLVWREQGLGDELLFASLYRDLIAAHPEASFVLECDARLAGYFTRAFIAPGSDRVTVAPDFITAAAAGADLHIPAGSLPQVLRGDLGAFTGQAYLVPDPARLAAWRARVDALGPGLRVGLCWQSMVRDLDRDSAYTRLADWAPLLRLPGVIPVMLQYGAVEEEVRAVEAALGVTLHRWADTDLRQDLEAAGALTSCLDLVVTAPTSVGELAGALGVPVWRVGTRMDWSMLGTAVRPWFAAMAVVPAPADGRAADVVPTVAAAVDRLRGGAPAPSQPPSSDVDGLLAAAAARHQAGDAAGALASYRAVLDRQPDQPVALHLLGLALAQLGRAEAGLPFLRRAVEVAPGYAAAQSNLGNVLQTLGRAAEAEGHYRLALDAEPDRPDVLTNLGNALLAQGRAAEAAACQERALQLAPDLTAAASNLGTALLALDRPAAAIDAFRRALGGTLLPREVPDTQDPVVIDALCGLGEALRRAGDIFAGPPWLERAVALAPDQATAWNNRGRCLNDAGRYAAAGDSYARAIELDPALATARFNRGLVDLQLGTLDRGWQGYAWRFAAEDKGTAPRFDRPAWRGESLAGRTLRVWHEQGLGDELLFASLYSALAARAADQGATAVLVECDPRLAGLLERSFPTLRFLSRPRRQGAAALEPAGADFVAAAGDLAALLAPTLANFARDGTAAGYLLPDPVRVAHWRDRLAELASGPALVVGIAWRSGQLSTERSRAYSTLAQWRSILSLPGVTAVSLHYQPAAEEIAALERDHGLTVHRFADADLRDDLETAAALTAACDLVIGAATAVGEMAGAVGTPCWRFASRDWTTLGTPVRPWFPSHRLFALEKYQLEPQLALEAMAMQLQRLMQ